MSAYLLQLALCAHVIKEPCLLGLDGLMVLAQDGCLGGQHSLGKVLRQLNARGQPLPATSVEAVCMLCRNSVLLLIF